MFVLDQRLQADTILIGRFPLCQVLLMNDKRYPWVILVPARNDVYEYYHLSASDCSQLMKESTILSEKMADHFSPSSMNVAALGNVVQQLHQHLEEGNLVSCLLPKLIYEVSIRLHFIKYYL